MDSETQQFVNRAIKKKGRPLLVIQKEDEKNFKVVLPESVHARFSEIARSQRRTVKDHLIWVVEQYIAAQGVTDDAMVAMD